MARSSAAVMCGTGQRNTLLDAHIKKLGKHGKSDYNINNKEKLSAHIFGEPQLLQVFDCTSSCVLATRALHSVVTDFSYPLEDKCLRTALHDVRSAQKLKDTHSLWVLLSSAHKFNV